MASKLGAALGFDMEDAAQAEDPMADPELADTEEPKKSMGAEVLAMKQFKRAETPEAMVQAMKDFLESCGLY